MAEIRGRRERLASIEPIVRAILVFRGRRVILDAELAALYDVPTKALNQAIKRNAKRFPRDFVFRLNGVEVRGLDRSQSVTGSQKHRDPASRPLAFTEHGAVMAATVLNSLRAVKMSIHVVRAFVQLRGLLPSSAALARRLDELEGKYRDHDTAITAILSALRELIRPPLRKSRGIGFTAELE